MRLSNDTHSVQTWIFVYKWMHINLHQPCPYHDSRTNPGIKMFHSSNRRHGTLCLRVLPYVRSSDILLACTFCIEFIFSSRPDLFWNKALQTCRLHTGRVSRIRPQKSSYFFSTHKCASNVWTLGAFLFMESSQESQEASPTKELKLLRTLRA